MNRSKIILDKKLLIWLSYNIGRNTNLLADADKIVINFENATRGNHKYCKCENKGKAVNIFWEEWHCTYCLKLKESLNIKA